MQRPEPVLAPGGRPAPGSPAWARSGGRASWRLVSRACALLLLAGVLALLQPLAGRAWDQGRMMVAARSLGPLAVESAARLGESIPIWSRQPEPRRVASVNEFINRRIAFADDLETTGVVDDWASPLESLGRGRGDCEDYAIAKYFLLRATGVPAQRLRLVYVRAETGGRDAPVQVVPHMVLAWYPTLQAEPLVLDNLVGEVLPASRRPDLQPVFSFNSEGLWQGVAGAAAGDPLARLSKWREVLNRARSEGFE